jgi:PIN domain nuclease of toxin-antitoxin system
VRLLLDTNVTLWWLLGNERLSVKGHSLIGDERNECFVSIGSLWEVAIKSLLGRGLPPGITAATYAELIDEAGFVFKDVRRPHALAVEGLKAIHGDPFDRLMVAQANCEGFTLVTSDKKLAAYGDFVILV